MTAKISKLAAATLACAIASCAPAGDNRSDVACDPEAGRCDGLDSLKSLLRDPRELSLDDLVSLGAPFATDAVNDALAVSDYARIQLADTEVHDASRLDQLVTGLAARFGDRELSTEINEIRRRHLEATGDEVFAEAAFTLSAGVGDDFGFDAKGFTEAKTRLGFVASGGIETRIVAAFDSTSDAILRGPLKALRESPRGFVLPRRLADIRAMKPGELVAMHGRGELGLNLGVGAPILIANPLEAITFSLVLSAGVKTRMQGDLDIQLVRLDGDQIVIDVGIENATVVAKTVALEDGWGVQGLLETEVNIAGISIDLGKLVDRAVANTLDRHLDLVSARLEHTDRRFRTSVARLRFDLGAGDLAVIEPAVAQALRGDVRLGQALANRKEPGVRADFDLVRSGASSTSFAGADFLGMSFFRKTMEAQGSAVVQSPGGARTILFDTLHRESGLFISRHGFTRVALSGLVFDPTGAERPRGEANLFVQLTESDKAMERDKLVDWADAVIAGLAGPDALAAVEAAGNQLEILVETECAGTMVFDECPLRMSGDPRAVSLRMQAAAALASASSDLDMSVRDLVVEAGRLRLLAQSVYEQKASLTGPGTWMVADYRLDDAALSELMRPGGGERLAAAMNAYLGAVAIDREAAPTAIAAARSKLTSDSAAKVGALTAKLDDIAGRYRRLDGMEEAALQGIGSVGAQMIAVRVPIDAQNRPLYEQATARSIAQERAALAAALFDELLAGARGLGKHAEQSLGFALIGATTPARADLRLSVRFALDDTLLFWREPYRQAGYPETVDVYGSGSQVAPIEGGQFSVDALIDVDD